MGEGEGETLITKVVGGGRDAGIKLQAAANLVNTLALQVP